MLFILSCGLFLILLVLGTNLLLRRIIFKPLQDQLEERIKNGLEMRVGLRRKIAMARYAYFFRRKFMNYPTFAYPGHNWTSIYYTATITIFLFMAIFSSYFSISNTLGITAFGYAISFFFMLQKQWLSVYYHCSMYAAANAMKNFNLRIVA